MRKDSFSGYPFSSVATHLNLRQETCKNTVFKSYLPFDAYLEILPIYKPYV